MSLMLLTSEMRLLARLVTDLPGTITCWTSEGWRERMGTEEWEKKQHLLFSCSPALEFIITCIVLSWTVPLPNGFCLVVLKTRSFSSKCRTNTPVPPWSLRDKQLSAWKCSWLLTNSFVPKKFISRLANDLAVLLCILSQYWVYLLKTNWFSV